MKVMKNYMQPNRTFESTEAPQITQGTTVQSAAVDVRQVSSGKRSQRPVRQSVVHENCPGRFSARRPRANRRANEIAADRIPTAERREYVSRHHKRHGSCD